MFNPTREQARRFFFDAWRKHRENLPRSALEDMAVGIILRHPEYHPLLEEPDRYLERDYLPEQGETNPFLHLSMHLAIREQLSIDQPRGIADHYRRILQKFGSEHGAEHAVMDCLGEMIWQAQRRNMAPDAAIYLDCLAGK